MNPDGTNRRQLTFPPEPQHDEHPSWSPDGTRLAFVRSGLSDDLETATAIVVINADGTGERPVATIPVAFGVHWSADGAHLAVSSPRGVYVINADGSGVRAIEGQGVCCPAWRP